MLGLERVQEQVERLVGFVPRRSHALRAAPVSVLGMVGMFAAGFGSASFLGRWLRYAWIQEHRRMYPVTLMCDVLKVSTSGFYDAVDRAPSPRATQQARIRQTVQHVYDEHHGIYGSRKIMQVMAQRDALASACRNTVAKAMNELGLRSRVHKAFVPTTTQVDPSKRPAVNLLDQDFTADAPNRKWVSDITYLPTQRGWVYLATVTPGGGLLQSPHRRLVAGRLAGDRVGQRCLASGH